MIIQRVFGGRLFPRIKPQHIENLIQVTCRTCTGLQGCRLSMPTEFPFLWAPSSCAQTNCSSKSSILLKKEKFVLNRKSITKEKPRNDVSLFVNKVTEAKYKSFRKILSADETFKPGYNNHIQIHGVYRYQYRFTPFFAGSTAVHKSLKCNHWLTNEENKTELVLPAYTEENKQESFSQKNSRTHMQISADKKPRNAKVLYFAKNSKHCWSQNTQLQGKKNLPRTNELLFETIIDNLTDEWPKLFSSKISVEPSLFSDAIYFHNNILGTRTRGLRLYKFQISCFKWATKLFWSDSSLQILQVTKNLEDNTIKIRWSTNGRQRLLFPLVLFGKTPSLRYMDFFSILKLGENDKVEAHLLSKLVPRQTPQRRNIIVSLFTLLGLSKPNLPDFQEEPVLPSSTDR